MRSHLSVDNLCGTSRAFQVQVLQHAASVIRQRGIDPATKAQAAAREAGHCVVAAALSERVMSARIWRTAAGAWVGANHREHEAYTTPGRVLDPRKDALLLARRGPIDIAGFAGEIVTNTDHPASSLDERFVARAVAAQLATVTSWSAWQQEALIMANAVGTVLSNRDAFGAVCTHLMREGDLNEFEAELLLSEVRPFDLQKVLSFPGSTS